MDIKSLSPRMARSALEIGLALVAAIAVAWLWPRVGVAVLGWERYWFAAGWLLLLAVPSLLGYRSRQEASQEPPHTIGPDACGWAAFVAAALFVVMLIFGRYLGNYKLWLGVVYLAAVSLRLAGLALLLREALGRAGKGSWLIGLAAAGIASSAGLLLLPWVGVKLVSQWPPPMDILLHCVAGALLWGGISGASLMLLTRLGMQTRAAWLGYLALAVGPGPALSVTWFSLLPLAGVLAILIGLLVLVMAGVKRKPAAGLRPMGLYWLLRAMMLLWWGVGAAVALASAWWQPHIGELFIQSLWLRALATGSFVVLCLGLLAEYSWPLVGRPKLLAIDEQRKVLGVVMSSLALLLILAPLVLIPSPSPADDSADLSEREHSDLLAQSVVLSPKKPEIEIKVEKRTQDVAAIYVVSHLTGAAAVKQGTPLALLTAENDRGQTYQFVLRAGVDTADRALLRRNVATVAKHGSARVAESWTVHTATGETFNARSYYTGLYLRREIHQLKPVVLQLKRGHIRFSYDNPPGSPPVRMMIKRVFLTFQKRSIRGYPSDRLPQPVRLGPRPEGDLPDQPSSPRR